MIKREGIKKGVYILPNLITLGSLFCGFFSIVRALAGDFEHAAWAILAAGIFDGLDGRIARLTRTQSDFGVELDSLVDLMSFGMAPAILAYSWNLHAFERVGWLACFVFVACGALRLARYNVQFTDEEKRHFQGLPIPIAAYTLVGYVIFTERVAMAGYYTFLVLTVLLSLLMVSKVRYRSFKQITFRRRSSFFVLVLLTGLLFVVASAPTIMIFTVAVTYVLFGLLEELRRSREHIRAFSKKMAAFFDEEKPAATHPMSSLPFSTPHQPPLATPPENDPKEMFH